MQMPELLCTNAINIHAMTTNNEAQLKPELLLWHQKP